MCMPIHNVNSNKICKKCDIKIVLALRGCRLLVPFVKTLFSFVVRRECGLFTKWSVIIYWTYMSITMIYLQRILHLLNTDSVFI
jgi:hypothetical protein